MPPLMVLDYSIPGNGRCIPCADAHARCRLRDKVSGICIRCRRAGLPCFWPERRQACQSCKKLKRRCDRALPTCHPCSTNNLLCVYPNRSVICQVDAISRPSNTITPLVNIQPLRPKESGAPIIATNLTTGPSGGEGCFMQSIFGDGSTNSISDPSEPPYSYLLLPF
jgi:hypothetical protein